MWRMLQHAVDCLNPECKTCDDIQAHIDDGAQHFPADMEKRMEVTAEALIRLRQQAVAIEGHLERSPVAPNICALVSSLVRNLETTERLLRDPLFLRRQRKRRAAVIFCVALPT